MKIVQIVPGSGGGFYCENCLRDRELLGAMRAGGHDALLVPLYLPLFPDASPVEASTPVFFGGINVYLQQASVLFRHTPRWVDRLFDSRAMLKWAAKKASMTRPEGLGATTLSMLRGEQGRQKKELHRLLKYLSSQDRPDVVFLSNALLLGLAGAIRNELKVPVVCFLQDEDGFLDSLARPYRGEAWKILARRAKDVDLFVATSRYYAEAIQPRLGVPADRVRWVHFGISTEGFTAAQTAPKPPVIGFLSQLCPSKGLHTLAEAFVRLKSDERLRSVRLRLAGGQLDIHRPYVQEISDALEDKGLSGDVEFLPNLTRDERLEFLPTLSVLSVPTTGPEAMGLFALEAWSAGVPVVLADHGAHGELVRTTGGGLLARPNDPQSLAEQLSALLLDENLARRLGQQGREAMLETYSTERLAGELDDLLESVVRPG